jgi:hypothetical protein
MFDHFALPISVQANKELSELQLVVDNLVSTEGMLDSRSFVWGKNSYSSARFYKFLFEAIPSDSGLTAIWKSKCLPKLRVFAWLLMMDRLNCKELMLRKKWNIEEGYDCVLCDSGALETRDHLFFQCPFAISCWQKIGISWNCHLQISDRFARAKQSFAKPCFMEIIICAAWNIWKERNDYIFND